MTWAQSPRAMQYLLSEVFDNLPEDTHERMTKGGLTFVGDLLPMSPTELRELLGNPTANALLGQDFVVYITAGQPMCLNFGTRLDRLFNGLAAAYSAWRRSQ